MAHLLAVASGLPSVVYPSVELARRLAADGHRVTFAGPEDSRALAEHAGVEFLPLEPSRYEFFLEEDAQQSTLTRLRSMDRRRALAREALAVDRFVDDLRRIGPDLVLVNGEMHEHVIATKGVGAPIALLNTFVSIWRRPGLPPPHCSARPGVGWAGSRGGSWLLWTALQLRKWRRRQAHRLRYVGCDRLSVLRSLASESGFDLARETDTGQWLIPFTYRHLPVLSLHALEFEFPHVPPAGVRYVGPMVLESRVGRPIPPDDRDRLARLFSYRKESSGRSRLIYAGFGSAFSAELDLLRRLAAAVAARPEWTLIVSLGGADPDISLGELPDQVHLFDWMPQLEVLRHADVMVTHGGINTIDECVLNGVPTLVYCGAATDMAGTTARVVHHGIGIAGSRTDDSATMARHLDELSTRSSFRQRLAELEERYLAYAQNRTAERAVEALLERGAPS